MDGRLGRERLGSVRDRKRLRVVRAQTEDEFEAVQQASEHRMLRGVAKQRARALESTPRQGAVAVNMAGHHTAKRRERDFERVAFGTLRRLIDDNVIAHPEGRHVMGVQPMRDDETRWFPALGFDTSAWTDEGRACVPTSRRPGLTAGVDVPGLRCAPVPYPAPIFLAGI